MTLSNYKIHQPHPEESLNRLKLQVTFDVRLKVPSTHLQYQLHNDHFLHCRHNMVKYVYDTM